MLGDKICGHYPTEWFSFLIFWALNIAVVYRGMNLASARRNWAAPFVLIMTALLAWIVWAAGGFGKLFEDHGKFHTFANFSCLCVPEFDGDDWFWATLSWICLVLPDLEPFQKKEQTVRTSFVALPTTMVVFAGWELLAASAALFFRIWKPEESWDPVKLVGQFSQPVSAISMFTIVIAIVGKYRGECCFLPANDLPTLSEMDFVSHRRVW